MKDHYKTLGIPYSATKAEVVSSFRQLAKKWHPDVCKLPNASENFQNVYEAYEILSDIKKREVYDCLISDQSSTLQSSFREPQYQTKYTNPKSSNAQRTYQVWEQEAKVKADFYSQESYKAFSQKIKHAFTPKVTLTGWFENTILPHAFLFTFFPVGLYMVWVSNNLPRWYQKTLTIITLISFSLYISLIFL